MGIELLGWEDCAENMSFRVDKAWRQRCSQRFRNILDMIAKKADHSVLRLLQISQQHIESQLERVKHERELWKEVVELQKSADMLRKMEKQRNQDEQNWKAQMDAVHDVLDTKVNEKPFEDLKHCRQL